MFVVTAILSCIIKIRRLFKSTKWRHFENVKFEALSARRVKQTLVEQGFSQPTKEYEEKLLDVGTKVRYLYEPGELEGYQYKGERRKRSTDPIWSVDVYKIKDRYVQKHQPTLYYLDGGPKRSFVFEELQPIQDP